MVDKNNTVELVKISDIMYATDNADGDGLSIMVGFASKSYGWRVSARISTTFLYEDSDAFFPSFVCAIDDLRNCLKKR